ncbi:MAG: DNA-binding protein WhiA [Bacilli bacterium]|nr:DNA-binding protein WhiA [Bacilli bacterium]
MTFATQIKDEVTKIPQNYLENLSELAAIVRYDAIIENNTLVITLENASIARRIYRSFKEIFSISPKIVIRNQKRFRIDTLYILEIKEKLNTICERLFINEDFSNFLQTEEERVAFFRGAFLACGSISDPKMGSYHFEMVLRKSKEADALLQILQSLNFHPKKIKRANKYMIYIKSAEEISDILKLFKATNSLFYFEDIRIYRDHKNMVNRLNNCEIANQEKSISTGLKQAEQIKYLKENDLLELLDEKTIFVAKYREKYPDVSYQELAEIISLETDYSIGKSGINHHFIKIKKLVEKHQNK